MATANTPAVPAQLRPIVDAVLTQLEQGRAPWVKPWRTVANTCPVNGVRRTPYRGINRFFLTIIGNVAGYSTGHWATYKAWQSVGGQVRKGEKGTGVVYYTAFDATTKGADGAPVIGPDGKPATHRVPVLRGYTVFNRDQVDGLKPLPEAEPLPTLDPAERLPEAEGLLTEAGHRIAVNLEWGGGSAYYQPSRHRVVLPPAETFLTGAGLLQTWAHELGHATGHETLLGRSGITAHNGFGSESYAREELVAELSSALCLQHLGVDDPRTADQTIAYCASWAKAIRQDPTTFTKACAEAQKAFALLFPDDTADSDPEA